ncbi:hypothetical protein LOTGIDRAFT_159134 [Lottia gigantea]|uniref:Uncharacterized protein n=1 Tax=Lottia gigantea TaxID=225164 RepID=V4AXN1_LOTGI|nr:hypothetical protein LOTGIDRAFT_159134 [Lottia gigantea]ESO98331.1 hypothetical protein LOTGIDRAFT_159134 [Lottia gigantea]
MNFWSYLLYWKAKLSGNMDLFGPDFLYSPGSDHVLPNGELPMYAASPNSLYLYEQERHDMQHLGNTQCYNSPQSHLKKENIFSCEDFDLNPQYEANLELPNNSITDTDVQQNFTAFSAQSQNGRNSNPTLTELNMGSESESFLEDLEAVIPKTPSFSNSLPTFSSVSQQNNTFTTLTTRTHDSFANNNYGLKTISSWPSWNRQCEADRSKSIQNIKTALQNSKSLPLTHTVTSNSTHSSSYSEDNKSRLQKLLMADDDSPAMSVVGMKRPLMSIKEEKDDDSVEEKWKEIEKYIHDDEESRPTREKRKRFATCHPSIFSELIHSCLISSSICSANGEFIKEIVDVCCHIHAYPALIFHCRGKVDRKGQQ